MSILVFRHLIFLNSYKVKLYFTITVYHNPGSFHQWFWTEHTIKSTHWKSPDLKQRYKVYPINYSKTTLYSECSLAKLQVLTVVFYLLRVWCFWTARTVAYIALLQQPKYFTHCITSTHIHWMLNIWTNKIISWQFFQWSDKFLKEWN